ncbi:tRNA wybutosine-synthesizing protein 3 homolog isoform X3 [Bufo bufo]|uniref:tRNA wybutosine-synthesizing protein 3 homolog isoform X3 n=1 Tax=Bufo bufo TaxID=8384 RepID=UPI001ABEB1F8|nr:tRNA wybutosine-synthesizing protein 3 homolog isoform X3 [Bufo bufo]
MAASRACNQVTPGLKLDDEVEKRNAAGHGGSFILKLAAATIRRFQIMELSSPDLKEVHPQPCSMENANRPISSSHQDTPRTPSSSESLGLFMHWKVQASCKTDLSKKGSVDKAIEEIVRDINLQDCYFTTSSCSGRIILIDEHSVAINSGFRNSGITVGKKAKIIMAVRSTHCLEVPLSHKAKCLVSEEYIDFLVQTANQKMEENKKRIVRFYSCLQTALHKRNHVSDAESNQTSVRPVYTRRRRKQYKRRDADQCEDSVDDEETSIPLFHDMTL